jgi:CheY-specific phosphatase CheX
VGELKGMITVRVTEPTGLGLAAVWAGMSPEELDAEDAVDTMAEFCNVFGGTAKTVLPAETSLEIPEVQLSVSAMPRSVARAGLEVEAQ